MGGVQGLRLPVAPIPGAFELVKNAVVLIQGTELAPKVVVDLVREGDGVSRGGHPDSPGPRPGGGSH